MSCIEDLGGSEVLCSEEVKYLECYGCEDEKERNDPATVERIYVLAQAVVRLKLSTLLVFRVLADGCFTHVSSEAEISILLSTISGLLCSNLMFLVECSLLQGPTRGYRRVPVRELPGCVKISVVFIASGQST